MKTAKSIKLKGLTGRKISHFGMENKTKYLKGTDWMRHKCSPNGGAYYKIIDGVRIDIHQKESYTSRSNNNYKRCYRVIAQKENGYLGQRSTFKKAMELAERGA